MSAAFHSPAAARGATTDVFGKLDAELALRINSQLLADIHATAHECGMGMPEFVRTLLAGRVYGIDHVRSLKEQRLSRVIGNVGHSGGHL